MSKIEMQYLHLLRDVLNDGTWQQNRTGIRTKMIPAAMLQHDLQEGFPLLTTRKLNFKAIVGELIGFLRGATSAAEFRELGCNYWNANANETQSWLNNPYRKGEDDLGTLAYSVGWNACPNGLEPNKPINQVKTLVDTLINDPSSRRMVVSAWHPELFERSALPCCHMAWGVVYGQEDKTINLWFQMRSVDTYLGLPSNLASYATLAHMLAKVTGYKVGKLTAFLADVHLYENHINQACMQMIRDPYKLPTLTVADRPDIITDISKFNPEDFSLGDTYQYHPIIKAPMAV